MFMTQDSLDKFTKSEGCSVGAGAAVALVSGRSRLNKLGGAGNRDSELKSYPQMFLLESRRRTETPEPLGRGSRDSIGSYDRPANGVRASPGTAPSSK
jgi:hypothetical protein